MPPYCVVPLRFIKKKTLEQAITRQIVANQLLLGIWAAETRVASNCPNRGPPRVPTSLPQMFAKEPQRAVPGLLGPDRVVLRGCNAAGADGGLVRKRVVCQVAVKLKTHTGDF